MELLEISGNIKTRSGFGVHFSIYGFISILTCMLGTNFEDIEVDPDEDKTMNRTELDLLVKYGINLVDNIAVLFFSVEYFSQLIICQRKWKFASNRINIIDLLAIAPFFLSAVLAGLEDMQVERLGMSVHSVHISMVTSGMWYLFPTGQVA